MSEGAPGSAHDKQNGHCDRAIDPDTPVGDIPSASAPYGGRRPDEAGGQQSSAATAARFAAAADVDTGPSQVESPSVPPHAEAEHLLSRAYVHAERLRAHAETARGEADFMRSEAAALRGAARDEAAAASARFEALTAQMRATAEELRSAIEEQAEATRAEVERLRIEAASLRRSLQAEIEAGLADAERIRAGLQDLWADKLAAERRRLSAGTGPHAARDEPGSETGRGQGARRPIARDGPGRGEADPLEELRRTIAIEVEQRLADVLAEAEARLAPAAARLPHNPEREMREGHDLLHQLDVGRSLREIWEAAYAESSRLSEPGVAVEPAGSTSDAWPDDAGEARARTSEPLIGSGGWCASGPPTSAAPPVPDPPHSETSPPPRAGRDRRRLRRQR